MEPFIDEFNRVQASLRDGTPLPTVRATIADLIQRVAHELPAEPSYWEKVHVASAANSFHHNAQLHESQTWLTISLLDLDHALLPVGTYDEDYTPRLPEIDRMTRQQLINAVDEVLRMAVARAA